MLITDVEEGASETRRKDALSSRSAVDKSQAAIQDERFNVKLELLLYDNITGSLNFTSSYKQK